jgi:alpha-glucosidase
LLNTTRQLKYDLGATSQAWFGFEAQGWSPDYYFLYGPSLKDILARYTDVTGKPPLPPKWALGLWFICRTQADAREFMDDCYNFRREHIPCDAIGLEPGWMATNYDFSVNKDWHPERFPIPFYAPTGRHNFLPAAIRMGFKPGLWLCCDYDLSYEEERRLHRRTTHAHEQSAFAPGHEEDEHLRNAQRMDPWTRPAEPWFHHLRKFVDQGVAWFKQDGANQVLEHPDRLWGNGMLDDEMHNLYPLLYSRQMYEGFREHTGKRPFNFTPAGWAGLQHYTATWTGDTGGEVGPLVACLNLSLSGHGMSTCDMEVTTVEGIHFGFLLPWSQVNSWNYWRHPWLLGEKLQAVFTYYARLRYRLLPYLYSLAREAHETGVPILRAMPLEFPDDPQCPSLVRQFMLGPAFLVGAFTDRVYLPAGEWYDFWSGQKTNGPAWYSPQVPQDRGGPLLVRAGSILPLGPEIEYVGQRPDDELTIEVFAGPPSDFVLYEDDGLTYEHCNGAFRTTRLAHSTCADRFELVAYAGAGTYEDAPDQRLLRFVVHGLGRPVRAELNGEEIPQGAACPSPSWLWHQDTATLTVQAGMCAVNLPTTLAVYLE